MSGLLDLKEVVLVSESPLFTYFIINKIWVLCPNFVRVPNIIKPFIYLDFERF